MSAALINREWATVDRVPSVNGSSPPPQLAVRDLGIARNGKWLFRNMNWDIPRGQFLAVVGPSGVGKTSLLDCLGGQLPPGEGAIHYRCQQNCLHTPGEFQKRIGVTFQNYLLIANCSLLTNVLCGRLGRYPWWKTLLRFPRHDREEAYRLLEELGLRRYVHRWAAEVSGGEQQRTAVARALFQEAEVILADEPVSNLDEMLSERVLSLLRRQAHAHGRTVICVLHNSDLVERYADLILSLDPRDPEGWQIRQTGDYGLRIAN